MKDEHNAVRDYTGSTFEPINEFLRGISDLEEASKKFDNGKIEYKSDMKSAIKQMDRAISQYNLKEPIVVTRGCSHELFRALKAGDEFVDNGYGSSSVLSSQAFESDVKFTITVPKGKGVGAYVRNISHFGQEYEFLLARGARYHVNKTYTDEYGIKNIDATIVGFDRRHRKIT